MLRFATGFSRWLPGVSAGERLGLDDRLSDAPAKNASPRRQAKDVIDRHPRSDDRLPPRDDVFYWSLMHSHL